MFKHTAFLLIANRLLNARRSFTDDSIRKVRIIKRQKGEHMLEYYVGIDISKFKHTIAIIDSNGEIRKKSFNISNDLKGFNLLLNELNEIGQKNQIKIGMEATGHYMNCLVNFLNRNDYKVQIINPYLVSRFRDSETNNGAKTDKLDAILVATYLRKHDFNSSLPISYNILEIRKIERAKYFLFADKIRVYNHILRYLDELFPELIPFLEKGEDGKKKYGRNILESKTTRWILSNYCTPSDFAKTRFETAEKLRKMSKGSFSFRRYTQLREIAKNSIGFGTENNKLIINSLINQVEVIEKNINDLNEKLEIIMNELNSPLLSIPGMGMNLAAMIIGEIGDIKKFSNPEKLVKFAGLDVNVYQSGTINKRGKISRYGSSILRYALSLCVQKLRIH